MIKRGDYGREEEEKKEKEKEKEDECNPPCDGMKATIILMC